MLLQNQWSSVFSSIVSRAMTMEVLSTGVAGNYNGALQVVRTSQICIDRNDIKNISSYLI